MFQLLFRKVRAAIAGLAVMMSGVAVPMPLFAQTDLPPIAAPTTSVAVQSLPLVRSESQQVTDFARGLVEGLMERENISLGALVIVTRDRVDMAEVFGQGVGENAMFALGSLSDLFGVASVLQLVEQGQLSPEQDLAQVLGEDAPGEAGLEELLTHRLDGSSTLFEDVVERVSGAEQGVYISRQILTPLGMARSRFERDIGMLVTAGDMSQFLLAFTNQTSSEEQSNPLRATIERMQMQRYAEHPALPGQTFGFAEMQRNGWRALQRDGQITGPSAFQSRVVIIPEMHVAYFASFAGLGTPDFWRALDHKLFDRLAPRADVADVAAPSAGTSQAAADLAGLYRSRPRAQDAVFLKARKEPLQVQAEGANLRLSGAEELVLRPDGQGVWREGTALIPAAFVQGALRVGNIAYAPLRAWQRAGSYLVVAGLLGMLSFAALALRRFAPESGAAGRFASREIGFGLAGVAAIFAAVAVALHSWT